MEINVENAFPIAVKISIRPFRSSFNTISQKIQNGSHKVLCNILEEPLISTLLITGTFVILLSILTMSLIVVAAASCVIFVIIIFEGLIFGVILILSAVTTILSISFLILLMGIKQWYEKQTEPNETELNI